MKVYVEFSIARQFWQLCRAWLLSLIVAVAWCGIQAASVEPAPSYEWGFRFGSVGRDEARRMTVDKDGNVFVVGNYTGSVDLDPGLGAQVVSNANSPAIFAAKYSARGALIWAWTTSDAGILPGNVGGAVGITLDAQGNVYAAGSFQGTVDFDPGPASRELTSVGGFNQFLLKLDPQGNVVWLSQVGAGADEGEDAALASDPSGNLYLTGTFQGTGDFDPGPGTNHLSSVNSKDVFLVKLNPSGDLLWARSFGGNGSVFDLAIDDTGSPFVAGKFSGTVDFGPIHLTSAGATDAFVAKLSSTGEFVWARAWGDADYQLGQCLAVEGTNSVYMAGEFRSTIQFGDTTLVSAGDYDNFLVRLDGSGSPLWARRFGGGGFEQPTRMKRDRAGNLAIVGVFSETVDFDPGENVFNLISDQSTCGFVMKLGPDAQFLWAKAIPGTGIANPVDIEFDPMGSLYMGGLFAGAIEGGFGRCGGVSSAGSYDGFVCKLGVPVGDPVIFTDDFEGPCLNPFWNRVEEAGSVTFPSDGKVHSGNQAVGLNSVADAGQKRVGLQHYFDAPQYGEASIWVYDSGAGEPSSNYLVFQLGNLSVSAWDYDLSLENGGCYYYQANTSTGMRTSVQRSKGWHHFRIRCTQDESIISIDGTTVYAGPPVSPFSYVGFAMYGPGWRPAWSSYFDDFSFVAIPPRLTARLSQIELCFPTLTNQAYQLEYSTALMQGTWLPLGAPINGTGELVCTHEELKPGQPLRFYRLVLKNLPR